MLSDDWYCDPTTSLRKVKALYHEKKAECNSLEDELNRDNPMMSKFDERYDRCQHYGEPWPLIKVWVDLIPSWSEIDEDGECQSFYRYSHDQEDVEGGRQVAMEWCGAHPYYSSTNKCGSYAPLRDFSDDLEEIDQKFQELVDSVKWWRDLHRRCGNVRDEFEILRDHVERWCNISGVNVADVLSDGSLD